MTLHVAVLMGGMSAEREVSLSSGRACADALRGEGYVVTEIDAGADLGARLAEIRPDVVFNALHGRFGEDGCVQGVMNLMRLPYTHSGVLASAIAMDKPVAKRLFAAAGLPVADGRVMMIDELGHDHPMPVPYVVKPAQEGSSVGVRIVRDDSETPLGNRSWTHGPMVLVERYIPGHELTIGVMDGRPLGITEIRPQQSFYDYEAKYTDGRAVHLVPAPVPDAVAARAMEIAVAAHHALGCRGVSRSDLRWDDSLPGTDGLILLEVNTQPGMTPLSLVPEQAMAAGISFGELVRWMVEHAACDA
ncbi:D-alanine--D-alanine ligase [Tistrella bauzanensis]|uniref:D-alanine--D-alanine ligase n=1 Tax=Tistrella bauzanensis TaxID=657419 RepID=A0ABQ1I8P5_9PROT|nr:D-alanine--D-alanine ligase [Tistrella bauzanensis]GGB23573.1 D-alanine--D-alanine ligase [Tistrella bauzanensis]